MTESRRSRAELIDAIIELARRDSSFRQELLQEPRSAIHSRFGIEIPSDYRIRFVERDPDVDALVVLPPADRLESETDELSDEDLEIVVGGFNAPKHGGMQFEWSDFV